MSVHGPGRRFSPVRGTQHDLLQYLRRHEWTSGVPALAGAVARPERNVWLGLAGLVERGLIEHLSGTFRVTRKGRAIRL